MRFGRDHLIFKALVVLDDAVSRAGDGPVQPTFGLRFALAYLFSVGADDRGPFDCFWLEMQRTWDANGMADYCRETNSRIALQRIMRSVGVEPTVEVLQALREARVVKSGKP